MSDALSRHVMAIQVDGPRDLALDLFAEIRDRLDQFCATVDDSVGTWTVSVNGQQRWGNTP